MNSNILNLRHLTVLLMLCTALLGGTISVFAQQGGCLLYTSKLILLLICIFCIHRDVYGQKVNYQKFENIYLGTEASVISCFLQDSEGMIWRGSNKGLFSYDGYSTQQHFTYGELTNTRIYCGIIIDNTYLYLGTDNGCLLYTSGNSTKPVCYNLAGYSEK